ncbi:MAG: hypothetical protein Pg6A_03490 [Termitinemataceae bacterium]|nr:MAG: hypothetical protein Pg6A_03490 [Termitinemataceae bacterium]
MTKSGLLFSGGMIAIALAFLIPALKFPGTSSDGAPGPGYFPIIICTIIILLSLITGVGYIKHKDAYFQSNDTERTNLFCLLISAIAIIIYSFAFMFLPFIPLTIVFIGFLNWFYKRAWKFNIIFSIVFTGVLYFIFAKFLHIMLR